MTKLYFPAVVNFGKTTRYHTRNVTPSVKANGNPDNLSLSAHSK
ncbi:hypothetical protein [Pedobacter caeni]|uniref:Uncharacterized protein n=1 Tax=Pedobacter caeni TaxID=288992 RepID=A0A1M5EN24_9SPHI|nr:hypothetical protein [Pedobacter caeni]SHF80510.1 hypothetical protein SAMN04488522_103713 [Pedobacter caeni]